MLIASRKIRREEACKYLQIGRKNSSKPMFPINEYSGAACMPKGSEFLQDVFYQQCKEITGFPYVFGQLDHTCKCHKLVEKIGLFYREGVALTIFP